MRDISKFSSDLRLVRPDDGDLGYLELFNNTSKSSSDELPDNPVFTLSKIPYPSFLDAFLVLMPTLNT